MVDKARVDGVTAGKATDCNNMEVFEAPPYRTPRRCLGMECLLI